MSPFPPQATLMPDGRRLHLQHGPIDIIAEARGDMNEVRAAYGQATLYFQSLLLDLVDVLGSLRAPVSSTMPPELSGISENMWQAASRFADGRFVTPMAAVAGAVADGVKKAMLLERKLTKLYVNNGGDISIHLQDGETFISGIVDNQDFPRIDAHLHVTSKDGVGGIATSGWRGRSLSPGIADAVTVLATNAAVADVAATLIAGDVFVKSDAVVREPASHVRDDTDLGEMMVTTHVGELSEKEKMTALLRGWETAVSFQQRGLIKGAYLALQGSVVDLSKELVLTGKRSVA